VDHALWSGNRRRRIFGQAVDRKTLLGSVTDVLAVERPGPAGLSLLSTTMRNAGNDRRTAQCEGVRREQRSRWRSARGHVAASLPELVILDLMLPKSADLNYSRNGERIRAPPRSPVFVLTSKDLTKQERPTCRTCAVPFPQARIVARGTWSSNFNGGAKATGDQDMKQQVLIVER